jgi:hypothetical protein
MLVPEEGLAASRGSLRGPELFDNVERSGDIFGSPVVERREPFGKSIGG